MSDPSAARGGAGAARPTGPVPPEIPACLSTQWHPRSPRILSSTHTLHNRWQLRGAASVFSRVQPCRRQIKKLQACVFLSRRGRVCCSLCALTARHDGRCCPVCVRGNGPVRTESVIALCCPVTFKQRRERARRGRGEGVGDRQRGRGARGRDEARSQLRILLKSEVCSTPFLTLFTGGASAETFERLRHCMCAK